MTGDPPGTNTFTGLEPGPDGKNHMVSRTTCAKCGTVLSQTHFGCCGHAMSGFGVFRCQCQTKEDSK